jgi:hypothetical protein
MAPRYGPPDATLAPRYTGVRTFARFPHVTAPDGVDAAVVGVPFDTATSFRPGARFGPEAIRAAIELPVRVYHRHGPLLRAISEAAGADPEVARGQAALLRRFDELCATALRNAQKEVGPRFADVEQSALALNRLNESYLLEVFGREPRVTVETATQTLTEIWVAALHA